MVTKEPQLSKGDRRDAARAQALKLQQEQIRREKRTRNVIIASVLAGLLVVVGVGYAIIKSAGPTVSSGITAFPDGLAIPSVSDAAGGISFGKSGEAGSTSGADAVRVDVYLDYMCPICGQFEETNGADLDALRASGDITMVVHPVSILDAQSKGSSFSTRAAQAFAYVSEKAPAQALAFNTAMFANQPAEATTGLTNDEIAAIATSAGVPDDVAKGIATGTYNKFVEALTEIAFNNKKLLNESGGFGTPTILINGEKVTSDWRQPGALTAEIKAAPGAAVAP
ncbi:Thioredoxin [Sanguibacter gelidistatuariae]|uniref:Thioredoxin n=1 Tax=Sanguibacter gelidistatuariae TaxID=1814289 RepID=A0A1G6PSQ5_9MICO|nr:DsbA family protein [Sanguibacter gelidistatuariae]SDC82405.1 Thioredoxin [Sanguibacter gelidistatuariae]